MRAGVLLFLATLIFSLSHADQIYKWTDDEGVVHYSSTAPDGQAKPAELPKINIADVKLPEIQFVSCDEHGGIDCAAGAAPDGSVYCRSGARGTQRFSFACSLAKLEVADVSEPNEDGQFTIFIRNSRAVEAQKVTVAYREANGQELEAVGPDTLGGYDIGEYVLDSLFVGTMKPAPRDIKVRCLNC